MWKSSWSVLLLISVAGLSQCAFAAVHDLAGEFDQAKAANPSGVWAYGYLANGGATNDQFLLNGSNAGFVPYDMVGNAGGGGGSGWTTGFGFPYAGVLNVPPNPGSVAAYIPGKLNDWPTAAGENPDYPFGIIGGHGPTAAASLYGWYGVKYTADSAGPVDIEVKAWQTGVYPVVPPDPNYGGNVRPHQMLITKGDGASQTILVRSPVVARHGWVNKTGTPVYTAETATSPGDPGSFPTAQDELDAAVRSSLHPNLYRVTGLNLNAGESVVISLAAYFGEGQTGFNGFNAVVRTGADRVATTRWDLSDDYNVAGSTAAGIGPDGAWSYGILKNGAFAPYDRPLLGRAEDAGTPERESHGWGPNSPGWFVSGVADPETGPVIPGMVKDYSGFNFTKTVSGGVVSAVNGDWESDQIAIHTPPATVDAARTSVFQWTAPRTMSVDANGGMWRLTLPDATDRRHEFELVKNGTVLASGTINELGFGPTDTNSANPESFNVSNIAVVQGDKLQLRISPLSAGGGALSADFNHDNKVDSADLAAWKTSFGVNAGGDADGNGVTNGNDFLIWQRQLGQTSTGGGGDATEGFIGVKFTIQQSGGAAAVVAEPTSAMLLALSACGMLSVVRRRKD
jgi:hypothetical protein